jgi:hypothetical protein
LSVANLALALLAARFRVFRAAFFSRGIGARAARVVRRALFLGLDAPGRRDQRAGEYK